MVNVQMPTTENFEDFIINDDFRNYLEMIKNKGVIITDPPYNQSYKYDNYHDKLPEDKYIELLSCIPKPCVIIHYPEQSINYLSKALGNCDECIAWIYNHQYKQFRLVTFFGIKPNFELIRKPVENPDDVRWKHDGTTRSNDWIKIPQVKNTSEEKTGLERGKDGHPCQIPARLSEFIINLLNPDEIINNTIIDPFMGSGSILKQAKINNYNVKGFEISPKYFEIAKKNIAQYQLKLL